MPSIVTMVKSDPGPGVKAVGPVKEPQNATWPTR